MKTQWVALRRLVRIANGGTPTPESDNWNGEVPWATPVDLGRANGFSLNETERNLTTKGALSGSTIAPKGSVLLSTRAPIGYAAINDVPMAFNQGCKALIPRDGISAPFLRYSLAHVGPQLQSMGQGSTFLELSASALASVKIPLSSTKVQTQIAKFLDRETAQIDELIGKQELLIKLLGEKRQAIITHAVTKGLNPDAPTKRSGAPWLGEVPAHWDVVGSRRIFRERGERARPDDEQLTASQVHGIISQAEFVATTGNRVTSVIKGEEILKHVEPNDFVISMRSFQGGLELSRIQGKISSAYVMLVPTPGIDVEYFRWLFKSDRYISGLQSTSNLVRDGQALRFANFAQLRLPVPPIQEQEAIDAWIREKLAVMDKLQKPVLLSLDLLRQRRAALISAAVTGKIDIQEGGFEA